jgi:hypothetical protein
MQPRCDRLAYSVDPQFAGPIEKARSVEDRKAPMSCGQRPLAPNISRSSEVSLSVDVLIVLTSDRSA